MKQESHYLILKLANFQIKEMIKQFLLVGLGGAIGSMLRYGTSLLTAKYYAGTFPLATFITNVLGCLLIGVLIGFFGKNNNQSLQFLFITGFCGGYTTFSTFAAENVSLWQSENYLTLIGYTLASVLIGFLAVSFGLMMSKSF
jgi:CrcB protein